MKLRIVLFFVCLFLLTSCKEENYSFYIDKENPNKKELERLFPLLDNNPENTENRFTVMSKILHLMLPQNKPGKMKLLVTDYINKNPNDPYNSYYYTVLAISFIQNGHKEFAIPYLHRVVTNYGDLDIKGQSTHYLSLKKLVEISPPSIDKINYYRRLIKYHSSRLENIGEEYYNLAKTYEECEMWHESIKAYETYLSYENTEIPLEPEAAKMVTDKVNFYHSDKKWVFKDLDTLIRYIRYAINRRDPKRLDMYRANDFFIVNWKSNSTDIEEAVQIESSKLATMTISMSKDFDPLSNENEVYIAVTGWNDSIWYVYKKWYFYFQRVDFPMDPEIHGGWEWAGIYLGEKL